MKKRIIILIALLLVFVWVSIPASARLFKGSIPVAYLTAPAAASDASVTGSCVFHGITFKTDGSNNITFTVYDSEDASGTSITPVDCVIAGSALTWSLSYDPGILCSTGIYTKVAVAGAGTCSFQVTYDQ